MAAKTAGRSFIEPGSPWPFVESFGSRVRDEVLSVEARLGDRGANGHH